MIFNQTNSMRTTASNKFADCVELTIEEQGDYTLNLQPTNGESKVMLLCFTDESAEEFTLTLSGQMPHESVVMNGKKSSLKLHAKGNKWHVMGSRKTNITN